MRAEDAAIDSVSQIPGNFSVPDVLIFLECVFCRPVVMVLFLRRFETICRRLIALILVMRVLFLNLLDLILILLIFRALAAILFLAWMPLLSLLVDLLG